MIARAKLYTPGQPHGKDRVRGWESERIAGPGFSISIWHTAGGPAADRAAEDVAHSLNEAQEFPWPEGGPTVEEVGGTSFLVRTGSGDLARLRWTTGDGEFYEWRTDAGEPPASLGPSGWRRMPAPAEGGAE
jgi:hypothetical protein